MNDLDKPNLKQFSYKIIKTKNTENHSDYNPANNTKYTGYDIQNNLFFIHSTKSE